MCFVDQANRQLQRQDSFVAYQPYRSRGIDIPVVYFYATTKRAVWTNSNGFKALITLTRGARSSESRCMAHHIYQLQ